MPIGAAILMLAACSSTDPGLKATDGGYTASPATRDGATVGYGMLVEGTVKLQCVPFARELSGIRLWGNAADWWRRAEGRYARSRHPEVGAVMVFRRTERLRYGHLAVVTQVLSDRQILVTHANWTPHRIARDASVRDVSPNNDWSLVRVWWPPTGRMGITDYPTHGFILSNDPASPQQLTAATPQAIETAMNGR